MLTFWRGILPHACSTRLVDWHRDSLKLQVTSRFWKLSVFSVYRVWRVVRRTGCLQRKGRQVGEKCLLYVLINCAIVFGWDEGFRVSRLTRSVCSRAARSQLEGFNSLSRWPQPFHVLLPWGAEECLNHFVSHNHVESPPGSTSTHLKPDPIRWTNTGSIQKLIPVFYPIRIASPIVPLSAQ